MYGTIKNLAISAICAAVYYDSCTLSSNAGVVVCTLILGGAAFAILTNLDRAFTKG